MLRFLYPYTELLFLRGFIYKTNACNVGELMIQYSDVLNRQLQRNVYKIIAYEISTKAIGPIYHFVQKITIIINLRIVFI